MKHIFLSILCATAIAMAQPAWDADSSAGIHPISQYEIDSIKARAFKRAQAEPTPGKTASVELDSTLYSALFAIGTENGRRYVPAISAINTSDQPVEVMFEIFGADGKPMMVPFRDANGRLSGTSSTAYGTIPPGAEAGPSLATDLNDRVRFGWIRISSDQPEALRFSNFMTVVEGTRWGVFTQPSVLPSFLPREIGIENSPSSKQTWISIVNPSEESVSLELTARRGDGTSPCKALALKLGPGQQIWKTAQSLMASCIRSGMPNYTLHVEAIDGEVVTQAYYDYGNLIFATAIVHEIDSLGVDNGMNQAENVAKEISLAPQAAVKTCAPRLDPMKPKLSSSNQEFVLSIDFGECNPEQKWLLKASAKWFTVVDDQSREVAALAGSGDARVTIQVDAADPRRSGGNRYGYLYVYAFENGRQGKLLARYSFSQPVLKL